MEGCYGPVSELGNLLSYGMHLNRRKPKDGSIEWDDDHLGFQIKDVRSTVEELERFIHELLDRVETMMKELFFGTDLPKIVLKDIRDRMVERKPRYSFLSERANSFENGHLVLFNSMRNLANKELRLLNEHGVWNYRKTEKYLAMKASFLKLLMLGNIL